VSDVFFPALKLPVAKEQRELWEQIAKGAMDRKITRYLGGWELEMFG